MKKSNRKSTSTLSAKRAETGRTSRGRGVEFQIKEPIKVKKDAELQKRIDMVVENALSTGPGVDVMYSYHKLTFHSSGLKVRRVG